MTVEMDAEKIRQMPPEERAKYDAQVAGRVMRFKEVRPDWLAFPDVKIPGYQRANYIYVGTVSSENPQYQAPIPKGDNFSFSIITMGPGKGIPLHAHTTEEVFFALTGQWMIHWGDKAEHEALLEPWDAISIPAPVMRGVRNVGTEDGFLLAIVGGGSPPPAIYHPDIIKQMQEWSAG